MLAVLGRLMMWLLLIVGVSLALAWAWDRSDPPLSPAPVDTAAR
jgi:hypothetical protein